MKGDARPLRGLRVLDLATGISGPYAAKLLRDAGADIIKVEEPAGDPLRCWTATHEPATEGEDSALFHFLNGGKQGVTLDFSSEAGRDALADLAAEADILLESFGPGGFEARGLAGMTARRGYPERGPVGSGGRFGEWAAGSCAALAALSTWIRTQQTGRGEHIDLSIFEAMLLCMTQYHTLDGQFRPELLPAYVECPSIEKTSDGWVGLACVTPPQWESFCAMMGRPEWGEDSTLVSADQRMKVRDTVHRDIVAWMGEHTTEEVIEGAALRRIPVSPVGEGANIAEMEQVQARGLLERGPAGLLQPRSPIQLHGVPRRPPAAAPARGIAGAAFSARERGAGRAPDSASRPLAGIKVLDLSAFWAGPMCTAMLAALGAEVVKVEAGKRPDGMRFVNTMEIDAFWEAGSIFHGANVGKKGIAIALDTEEGKDLFLKLVADADVLVENFSVRVMENFGFTPERLHEINPRLVFVRMPSWGLDGPWRDRVGFAMTIEQCTGLAWISGYHDRPLTVNVCDSVGALHSAFGILVALEDVRETGRGRLVEVPLVEPGLTIGAELIMEASRGRTIPREGNRGPLGAPQGCYRGSDGEWVALSVETDDQWTALVTALGRPPWMAATGLEKAVARREAHDALDEGLAAWAALRSADEAETILLAAGVPASVARNAHRVMPNTQLDARGFFEEFEHPFVGTKQYPTLPWRSSWAADGWYSSPPPTLGQHNAEVLGGRLGLSADDLARLEAAGVIASKLG
jgi:crotonobetainyl-CoA:carnitine CoA-transferase CaiB-like acyl-CoA transferase